MKGKLIAFASILCIASLMASGANADKPATNPGHDDKPGNQGKTQTELIVFTGELTGEQDVEGCCLNRGPFPEYTLTLTKNLSFDDGTFFAAGRHAGHVYMSHSSVGKDRKYVVQFWTDCHAGIPCEEDDHICIEINGGVEDYDRKAKVITVTFINEPWNVMGEPKKVPTEKLNFVLTRTPN